MWVCDNKFGEYEPPYKYLYWENINDNSSLISQYSGASICKTRCVFHQKGSLCCLQTYYVNLEWELLYNNPPIIVYPEK